MLPIQPKAVASLLAEMGVGNQPTQFKVNPVGEHWLERWQGGGGLG